MVDLSTEEVLIKLFEFTLIFGPVSSFYLQVRKMRRTGSSTGVSKLVTFILLHSNILRLYFLMGKEDVAVLSLQSIVMVVTMLFLLFNMVKYDERGDLSDIDYFDVRFFWNWTNFFDYVCFLLLSTCLASLSAQLFGLDSFLYVEMTGFFALGMEACLGLPLVYQIGKTRNVANVSQGMVLLWMIGDAGKSTYYVFKSSPIQFLTCGIFQLCVDLILLAQIKLYRKDKEVRNSIPIKEYKEGELV